jgi:hypothetical protein
MGRRDPQAELSRFFSEILDLLLAVSSLVLSHAEVRSAPYVDKGAEFIDSSGLRMDHLQTWIFGLQPSREFLPGLSSFAKTFYPPSSLFSSMEMRIRLGPVTNGLKNSPTGSKNLNHEILATN